jgi:hypothetical protein
MAPMLQERPEPCHAGNEWQASGRLRCRFDFSTANRAAAETADFPPPSLASFPLSCPDGHPDSSNHSGSAMHADGDIALARLCRLSSLLLVALLRSDAFPFPALACQTPQNNNSINGQPMCLLHHLISTMGYGRWWSWQLSPRARRYIDVNYRCGVWRSSCVQKMLRPALVAIDPGCWLAVRSTKTSDK